ncbi:putative kinetochore protein fta4 [Aspergillus campestris IBT 28561]|uniref:Kinetochore protein fta4 n=1 Tax=Aspergillus campestris (strain IBT 28561) TaxID=1392248 RepID=A0A2I1DG43_ASPC2|nr:putative kinetochore protein fta4 [Aspergillus campestris IBT 28561]PKY08840.1 putative kinetochore protein fta4 [Aspergillus campestris IBT 28561]
MESTRTITELKSSFIRAQIRILSERIEPPEDWRSYATGNEEDELREKVVEDVIQKFNTTLKQHNRIVYPSQAVQHVAQQISSLYWSSVSQDARNRNSLRWGVEKSVDLSSHMNITQLPTELEDQLASEEDRIRYQQLRERLVSLDDQRQQRRQRLDQLRRLQELLEPFGNPQENIQPNLVKRDGELVQELEKMRMLAARVGGRIEQNRTLRFNQGSQDGPLVDSDQKLAALMDMTWEGDN